MSAWGWGSIRIYIGKAERGENNDVTEDGWNAGGATRLDDIDWQVAEEEEEEEEEAEEEEEDDDNEDFSSLIQTEKPTL